MAPPKQASRTGLLVGGSILACLLVLILLAWGVSTAGPDDERVAPDQLNAILVVVDDMDDFACEDTAAFLPRSSRWLSEGGTCFQNATVTDPVCCPARGTTFTGQLPHNSGVIRQIDAAQLDAEHTIQDALGERGLRTYGTGKYINGVNASAYITGEYDPGFQEFQFWNNSDYYRYRLIDDDGEPYLPDDRVHTTERTGRNLRAFIEDAGDEQFYAYAGFFAPHTQRSTGTAQSRWPRPSPANEDREVPPLLQLPERDRSDKLGIFQQKLPSRKYFEAFHRVRVQALYDIDDQLAATFELLEERDIADRTAVFFVSDNGYALGSNGWDNKGVPYPSSIQVPMLAYLPGTFAGGETDTRQVGLVDIAPTLYDLYDLKPNHMLDGRSLRSDVARSENFFEFQNEQSHFVLKESGSSAFRIPTWAMYTRGIRSYVEYYAADGSVITREYYADPSRTHNLLHPSHAKQRPRPKTLQLFQRKLRELRRCAGTAESGAPNPCP